MLVVAALAAIGLPSALFGASGAAAFESQYMDRGEQVADESFQATLQHFLDQGYIGAWTSRALDGGADEYTLYAGWIRELNPLWTFDAGLTAFLVREAGESVEEGLEPYVGVTLEYLFRPAVYLYYDSENRHWVAEVFTSREFKFAGGLSLAIDAYAGSVWTRRNNDPGWSYLGGAIDCIYAVGGGTTIRAGLRLSHRDTERGDPATTHAWWGVSVSTDF